MQIIAALAERSWRGVHRSQMTRRATPVLATRILAALLISAIIVGAGSVSHHVRMRELDEARSRLAGINLLLAEETSRSLQGIQLLETNIADRFLTAGLDKPGDLNALGDGREMHDRLQQLIVASPQLDAVSIVDRVGTVRNTSRQWPAPTINIADREHFQRLITGPTLFAIGEPVRNRVSNQWTIYLGRRLLSADGQFAGTIEGAIRVDSFLSLYARLNLPVGSSIGLWRDDGMLLAHFPDNSFIDRRFTRPFLFTGLRPGEQRVRVTSATLIGDRRLVAVTRLNGLPVVVAVTQTVDSILGAARLDTDIIWISAALLVGGVIGLAQLVAKQFRTYDAVVNAIAAREQAERSLNQAETKLLHGQKMEATGRLTAGVAHDFNNLLTIVRANAELLLNTAQDEKIMRRVTAICQAADRGAALTGQMLAFSRQQILKPASVDVNERLQAVSELLRTTVGTRVTLELKFATALWPAYVDAAQLDQAILNLVINARDATEAGGFIVIATENLALEAGLPDSALDAGDYVRVTVSDTGTGMPAEVANRAFDPFFTTKEQGKGTGLGLSQAQGFARQSGGEVVLETALGRGSVLRVLLPRAGHAALAISPAAAEAEPHVQTS